MPSEEVGSRLTSRPCRDGRAPDPQRPGEALVARCYGASTFIEGRRSIQAATSCQEQAPRVIIIGQPSGEVGSRLTSRPCRDGRAPDAQRPGRAPVARRYGPSTFIEG